MYRKNSRKGTHYSSVCENLVKTGVNKKCVDNKTIASSEVEGKLHVLKKHRFHVTPDKNERMYETNKYKTVENYYPMFTPEDRRMDIKKCVD